MPERKPAPHDKGLSPPLLSRHQWVVRTKRVSTPASTPHASLPLCACFHHSGRAPPPSFSSTRNATGAAPRCMGRDMVVPPQQGHPPPIGHAEPPHTPTSPHQRREHQPSKRGRGGGTTLSHHPKQARQHQSTQTPKGEHAPRVNTKPSHPQANTPTTSPNKARPQANTKSAHARARGQARCVSAGGPACPGRGDRHEAKQAKPPQGRARRTSAHKASAQTTWFAPKRCRPAPARRG